MHPDVVKLLLLDINIWQAPSGCYFAYTGKWPHTVKFIRNRFGESINSTTQHGLARMVLSKIALHGSVT